MSTRSILRFPALPSRPTLELLKPKPVLASTAPVRVIFWTIGILLAALQAWAYRFAVSPDSISYLDMSDGMLPGGSWHRLINGVWSPLYPLLVGLARRVFPFSPANEIAAAHLLNLGFFLFAFACFEFFLHSATAAVKATQPTPAESRVLAFLPPWAYLSLASALFLWVSISEISLRNLRPDMLMSGFLYLAVGVLLRMQRSGANWNRYLLLGVVLGVGYLAKAPMLPIGTLILVATLFAVENWRPAVKMAAAAFALMMLIGSLYFIPLSRARGHFTLGESSTFNYLLHIDFVRPGWYLQDLGHARGSFTRSPEKIFSSPPAYAFALPHPGTYPLRFDPSDWIQGVRPRLLLRRQLAALLSNFKNSRELLLVLGMAAIAVFMVGYFSRRRTDISMFRPNWLMCLIGIAGCVMYALVHVEPRYVGAFLVLFWCGVLFSIRVPIKISGKLVSVFTLLVIAGLLLPVGRVAYVIHRRSAGEINGDALAAAEIERMGVHPGDQVARICPLESSNELGMERIARVVVAAEVDFNHTSEFWRAPVAIQHSLLQTFAARGIKAVIATSPTLDASNRSEWTRLGATEYWVWRPNRA